MKLFLGTSNAKRVLFIVDRLELEDQANRNLIKYLKNDFTTVIYKQTREDWNNAEIVVTTIPSFISDNTYKLLFQHHILTIFSFTRNASLTAQGMISLIRSGI
jgi:type I restriction enzyme R subunit